MNFDNVFAAYPDVDRIYVVDGMPFVDAAHARNHARDTKKAVQVVNRKAVKVEAPQDDPEGTGEPTPPVDLEETGEPTPPVDLEETGEPTPPVDAEETGEPTPPADLEETGKKGKK